MRRLRKLARLSGSDWADLLEAQVTLAGAQLAVWTRPRGRFVARVAALPGQIPSAAETALARRLELAVGRAAEHGVFRPACLVRSLALKRMLVRRGLDWARLRIGVRLESDKLAAHAWVELGELVLGDHDTHVQRYDELTELDVLRGT
jgi:hypothetical protein